MARHNQSEGERGAHDAHAASALPQLRDSGVFGPSLKELRPSTNTPKRFSAVSLPNLKHSDILLPLQPALDRERLRPASFPNIKAVRRPSLRLPTESLTPVKLITRDSLPAAVRKPARAAAAVAPEFARLDAAPPPIPEPPAPKTPVPQVFEPPMPKKARPAGAAVPEPPVEPIPPRVEADADREGQNLTRSRNEPLWHSLFSPTNERAKPRNPAVALPGTARDAYVRKSKGGFDWGAAGNIEIDDLTDSKTESKELAPVAPTKRIWFWQAIEGVFLSRTFARSLAVVTIALFASTLDMPWRDWMQKQAARVKTPIVAALAQLSKPIEERAAFFIVDDFTGGMDNWLSAAKLDVDPAGWLTVGEGLALRGDTTRLEDYRFDFDAKIQSNAVGWLVRAPDKMNYYAFKLHQGGTEKAPIFSLSRFSVIDGIKTVTANRLDVPANLARLDDFNRISVRVVGDNVTTLLNGWGVDFWTDEALPRGGVGLLADAGEQALVRKMTVSGNDDTWGLLLYGALESMQSVQEFFSDGSANPAMLMFHRPMLPRQTEVLLLTGDAEPR